MNKRMARDQEEDNDMPNIEKHETISGRGRLFSGSYMDLERIHVVLPDGREAHREIVRVRDAVAVLPMDIKGSVHLVRQFRPAIEKTITEIPAGLIDTGESAEDAARRECEEETGYRPGTLRQLLTYAHAEGYSTGFMTLFLGSDLTFTGFSNPDSTEALTRMSLPFETLLSMVRNNEFCDSKTILSTLLAHTILTYDFE